MRERERERERKREREGLHIFTSLDENRETATALLNELNPNRYCMEHVVFKLRISERENNCITTAYCKLRQQAPAPKSNHHILIHSMLTSTLTRPSTTPAT